MSAVNSYNNSNNNSNNNSINNNNNNNNVINNSNSIDSENRSIIHKQKYYNLEVRFMVSELFSEFVYTLLFHITTI